LFSDRAAAPSRVTLAGRATDERLNETLCCCSGGGNTSPADVRDCFKTDCFLAIRLSVCLSVRLAARVSTLLYILLTHIGCLDTRLQITTQPKLSQLRAWPPLLPLWDVMMGPAISWS